jgi:hypothetical protein
VRIATLGEDTMHDAVLRGLAERWCPGCEVATGEFRGKSKGSRRKQLYAEYERLMMKGSCDCAAILVDEDTQGWKSKVEGERAWVPLEYRHVTAIGAPARNIECWIVADVADFCGQTGADARQIQAAKRDDPKGAVRKALQLAASAPAKVHEYTMSFVQGAPLGVWLDMACFKGFYEECRGLAQTLGCALPNEADCKTRLTAPPD